MVVVDSGEGDDRWKRIAVGVATTFRGVKKEGRKVISEIPTQKFGIGTDEKREETLKIPTFKINKKMKINQNTVRHPTLTRRGKRISGGMEG